MTPEQLQKLPKWAQEHIRDLQRQRDEAIKSLNRFCDDTTPSPFSIEDHVCSGEQRGPSRKRAFVQAHAIQVRWQGVRLDVNAHDYGNYGSGIMLRWSSDDHLTPSDVALVPHSYQAVRLVAANNLR